MKGTGHGPYWAGDIQDPSAGILHSKAVEMLEGGASSREVAKALEISIETASDIRYRWVRLKIKHRSSANLARKRAMGERS